MMKLKNYFNFVLSSKPKKILSIVGALSATLVLVFYGQNCSKTGFQESSSSVNTALAYSDEDDIWYRIESGKIKVKQLTAISAFSDNVSKEVLEGKSPASLSRELQSNIVFLEDMLLVQKKASNDVDIVKKYTTLIDLLSNSRDMLLAFYMNEGFARSAKDLLDAKNLLQGSIDSLSASHQNLQLSHNRLQSDVTKQGESMTAMQRDFLQKMNALEVLMDKKVKDLDTKLSSTLDKLNKELTNRIVSNEEVLNQANARIDGNTAVIVNHEQRIKEIEDKLKPQVEYLLKLADETRKSLDAFAAQFEQLRNAGNTAYVEQINNWACSEDLIDKNGAQFLNLPASVSEACVRNKEEVLYGICVARYPTFCGPCKGKTLAQCQHWNNPNVGLTPIEKLEILINIRQEIAIEFLTQQTNIHHVALFGSPSCKRECLKLDSAAKIPASCTVSDLDQCGVEGQIMSLKINDINLANKMVSISDDLNSRINVLNSDFAQARDYSNQRFAQLQSYVDVNLNQIRSITETKFNSVVSALNGVVGASVASKPLLDSMNNACLLSAKSAAEASAQKGLITESLTKIPGWDALSAQAISASLEADTEDTLRVLSQSSVSAAGGAGSLSEIMTNIMLETFFALNADQKNIPAYDALLASKVASVCPANLIKKTPFTNVVGRDPMEIIAIGAARRILFADGLANVGGAATVFKNYTNPVIKGSALQQAFFATVLDYRKDISVSAPEACLMALDSYAKEVLSSASLVTNTSDPKILVVRALNSGKIQGLYLQLAEQSKLISAKLESIQSAIIERSVIPANDVRIKNAVADFALRLIQASTKQTIAALQAKECDSFASAYRALVPAAGQSAFDLGLQKYIQEKNALVAKNQETFDTLNAQIAKLQADGKASNVNADVLAKQIADLKAAVGNLPTMAAVNEAVKALDIPGVKAKIDDLNNKIVNLALVVPDNFDPKITAVRHNFDGSGQCNMNQLTAEAFPTSSQFNGGYLACSVNFRVVDGDHSSTVFGWGSNSAGSFWLKVWGSATKIDVNVAGGANAQMTGDFSGMAEGSVKAIGGVNLKLASGSTKDGAFMMNLPSLLGNFGQNGINPQFTITPSNAPVNKKGASVNYTFTMYSPLVFAFNQSDSLSTLSMNEGVQFDLMGYGIKNSTGWVSASQGAFLTLDLNNNGRVDDGTELFGEASMLINGSRASNGFEALAQYDSNSDSIIDKNDVVFDQLKLWFDLNQDGKSQQAEFRTLKQMQINQISLQYQNVASINENSNGNKVLYKAQFFGPKVCGTEGCTVFDVFFNNVMMH